LCFPGFSQDRDDSFFQEFYVSLNRTSLHDDNTEDRMGFGIGFSYCFLGNKTIKGVFGLEYNNTQFFKKRMYEAKTAYSTDLTYYVHSLSFPLGIRFFFGRKNKLFIEAGGFADLVLYAKRKGFMHTYYPLNNQMYYQTTEINHKAELSNSVGFFAGMGIRIPLTGFDITVKPEYKFGVNKIYQDYEDLYNRYIRLCIGIRII